LKSGRLFSPHCLFEDRIIHRQIRELLAQLGVFAFQRFQPSILLHPHAAILSAPAVVSLIGDAQGPTYFSHRLALTIHDFRLAQLVANLFRLEDLFCHVTCRNLGWTKQTLGIIPAMSSLRHLPLARNEVDCMKKTAP
jgi:hypothetical protein